MNEEQLISIETKLAYQEDMIDALNKTVYRQQQQLDVLDGQCKILAQQIRSLAETGTDGKMPIERPPHY
jgi:SlyX protein